MAVQKRTAGLDWEDVRYFAAWDGQDYPYQPAMANELSEQQKDKLALCVDVARDVWGSL